MSPYTMPSAPILSAAKLPRGACDGAPTCFADISATGVCRFEPFVNEYPDEKPYYLPMGTSALIYLNVR